MEVLHLKQQKHDSCHCFPLYSIFLVPKERPTEKSFVNTGVKLKNETKESHNFHTGFEYFVATIAATRKLFVIAITAIYSFRFRSEGFINE
jgi:hypothetical protein